MKRLTRRQFLGCLAGAVPAWGAVQAGLVEPQWLRITQLDVAQPGREPLVFGLFSDLHYKGDKAWAQAVVAKLNDMGAAFHVFAGDLVENGATTHLDEALACIGALTGPVFGVPGNHDPIDDRAVAAIAAAFAATGGAWLEDESRQFADLEIVGITGRQPPRPVGDGRRLLITHYPKTVDTYPKSQFDLVVAGHSHGGQIRVPGLGALVLPPRVGPYDRGLFPATPAGPLYVSVGVGTYQIPLRFCCRPEITRVTL